MFVLVHDFIYRLKPLQRSEVCDDTTNKTPEYAHYCHFLTSVLKPVENWQENYI